MHSSTQTARNHGFTLVEMLVVIMILALLISLLFPVVSRVQENARSVKCSSNLHQLALGWMAHAGEHGGKLMGPENLQPRDWLYRPDGTRVTLESLRGGQLFPYLPSEKVFRCPSDKSDIIISYSIMGTLGLENDRYKPMKKVTYYHQLRDPSRKALMVEEHDPRWPYPQEAGFWLRGGGVPMRSWWKFSDWQAWRHRGCTNVSFCDGHVETWKALDADSPYIVDANQPISFDNPDFIRLFKAFDTRPPHEQNN